MNWLLKIKVFNQNKDLKIQSIFCWDEIHLNCCLCWSWINFLDCLRTTSSIIVFQSLEKLYPTSRLHWRITFYCFWNIFQFFTWRKPRESKKWKCFDTMFLNNITVIHFKKGIRIFRIQNTKVNQYKFTQTLCLERFSSNNSKNSSK